MQNLILESGNSLWDHSLMPRIARAVAAGIPHHVTQRGNRRQRTFFAKMITTLISR